ncbi:MAG: PaaI family thioesterase [Deltaproteobacteria bacterium]|nr:PaaI family thioesterase [Deltaproteobacteria bacterium]MBW2020094.1 PaaI family thioesterase [Deltaproteobacteria bacterium]MBW2074839.1 PaaI family thioesterase [Deltaproteobacteria bacterium]
MADKEPKKKLSDDRYCFACGPLNPIGLRMEVSYSDNKAFSKLTLKREFQGWKDIVHGGVVATILDEIMAHAVMHYVGQAVTTLLQITYRAPLHVGEEFEVMGYVAEQRTRAAIAKGEIRIPSSKKLIASGESKFILHR